MRRIDRLAVAAEVLEHPFDDRWFLDTGDQAQPAAAAPPSRDVIGQASISMIAADS